MQSMATGDIITDLTDLTHPLPEPPGDGDEPDGWSALCEEVAEDREAFEREHAADLGARGRLRPAAGRDRRAEQASTRRTYRRILRWVVAEFSDDTRPDVVDPERFAEWFTARWEHRAVSTS